MHHTHLLCCCSVSWIALKHIRLGHYLWSCFWLREFSHKQHGLTYNVVNVCGKCETKNGLLPLKPCDSKERVHCLLCQRRWSECVINRSPLKSQCVECRQSDTFTTGVLPKIVLRNHLKRPSWERWQDFTPLQERARNMLIAQLTVNKLNGKMKSWTCAVPLPHYCEQG